MSTHVPRTVELGELVVAAFDAAARYSADPREVSRLATQAVARMMRRAHGTSHRHRRQAPLRLTSEGKIPHTRLEVVRGAAR